jgi:hypothetical protein
VRLRVLLVSVVLAVATLGLGGHTGVVVAGAPPTTEAPPDTVPSSTFNDFIPEEQPLSDCISAAPRPGCGSASRSDYHQWLVFLAVIGGMVVIAWRVVAGARRRRPDVDKPAQPAEQAHR